MSTERIQRLVDLVALQINHGVDDDSAGETERLIQAIALDAKVETFSPQLAGMSDTLYQQMIGFPYGSLSGEPLPPATTVELNLPPDPTPPAG